MSTPSPRTADWFLKVGDCLDWRWERSGQEAFTKIYITFTDAESGAASEVHAEVAGTDLPLLERVERATVPLQRDEAQALADRAVDALGGLDVSRAWAAIELTRPIEHGSGSSLPAAGIKPRDGVVVDHHPGEFLRVLDVTPDRRAGTVLVQLAGVDLGRRLDVELELLAITSG